jgi:hypothetical protein
VNCKQCGDEVIWKRVMLASGRGQWQCFNNDGVTVHWDSCSKRRWQQTKATGERFESASESGYANSVHGTKFDRLASPVIRGQVKLSGQCRDCVPPWEVCSACPDAFPLQSASRSPVTSAVIPD